MVLGRLRSLTLAPPASPAHAGSESRHRDRLSAAAAAVALIKGQKPKTTTVRKNGSVNEPTIALPVTWITKANYKQLFTKKFLKKSDVCVGVYAKYCK